MAQLEPLQVGVMFWTGGELGSDTSPDEIAKYVRETVPANRAKA